MTVHSEKDQLEAIRNQLIRRVEAMEEKSRQYHRSIQARIARFKDQIRMLDEVRKSWDEDLTGENGGGGDVELPKQAPISESIDRYVEETGKQEFAAADILHYLQAQGYSGKHLYNSVYETLTRRVKSGKLVKEQGKFKVVQA